MEDFLRSVIFSAKHRKYMPIVSEPLYGVVMMGFSPFILALCPKSTTSTAAIERENALGAQEKKGSCRGQKG
jgi:hypothetical protein